LQLIRRTDHVETSRSRPDGRPFRGSSCSAGRSVAGSGSRGVGVAFKARGVRPDAFASGTRWSCSGTAVPEHPAKRIVAGRWPSPLPPGRWLVAEPAFEVFRRRSRRPVARPVAPSWSSPPLRSLPLRPGPVPSDASAVRSLPPLVGFVVCLSADPRAPGPRGVATPRSPGAIRETRAALVVLHHLDGLPCA
jgi:hypothetical protein